MLFKNYDQIISNGQTLELQKKRKDILDILTVALESVNPYNAVKQVFKNGNIILNEASYNISDFKNIYVVGFGKASYGMAQAVCEFVSVTKGVIITNDSSVKSISDKIDVVIGGHPIPNKGSIQGADKVIEVINQCRKKDLLLVLISGGGSALLCKPRVSLEDLQVTTDLLLKCGADINEINTIRKHLSYVKGGQLVQLTKGTIISLIISDIVNDPIEFISSGPTYPDSTTFSDAKKILDKYHLWNRIPIKVSAIIDEGIDGKILETSKNGNPIFNNVHNFVVANNRIACIAAIDKAKSLGYKTKLLTTSLTGEAKNISAMLLDKVKDRYKSHSIFISGGEPTVTIEGNGKGGRNQELVLGGVKLIENSEIVLASFATDGIDGKSDAAGAIADGFTFSRAVNKGLNSKKYLEKNNSYEFFSKLKDLLITGPTGTNIMDIQIILI